MVAVEDDRVMPRNGPIGLGLLEQSPDFDAVGVGMYVAEPETHAHASAAFAAGGPVDIELKPSFVDGGGGPSLIPCVWDARHGSGRRRPSRHRAVRASIGRQYRGRRAHADPAGRDAMSGRSGASNRRERVVPAGVVSRVVSTYSNRLTVHRLVF